jgi:conjugative transposon TraM protein
MTNNNQTEENKLKLTIEQKQKMKKYAVFALMFIIFGAALLLIFAPSKEDKAKKNALSGFNSDIPMPKEEGIIGDKKSAYEEGDMKQKQDERMRSLQDFSELFDSKTAKADLALLDDEPVVSTTKSNSASRQSSIQSSAQAYHDINRTLGNFYETPKEDPEKQRLKEELEALKNRMDESETRKKTADEQMAMMEKSFQMASKYLPMSAGTTTAGTENATEPATKNAAGKTTVVPVNQVRERTVSALQQEISSMDIVEALSKPRNLGFVTVAANVPAESKNTISACILSDQTILDGQSVRLRLLEPMQAGSTLVPRNTILTGAAKIGGERLGITVNSLEYLGKIIPVELTVYDSDGQRGIFIPDLQEMNAVKEIAANMGTNAGTSINLSNDAGEQFVADMGRNLIQGVSQFTSKKLREVKVNLKAGYKILLLPNDK